MASAPESPKTLGPFETPAKTRTNARNFPSGSAAKTPLLYNAGLSIYDTAASTPRSNIVCTIGPASHSVETLSELMKAGMRCVRINFSHVREDYTYPDMVLANARKAADDLHMTVCIALDTKGPEIRTGNFIDDKEYIIQGESTITVHTDPRMKPKGNATQFWVDYTNICNVIKVGDLVYVDDGLLSLKVTAIGTGFTDAEFTEPSKYKHLTCEAQNTAAISNHKGCNLPNVNVDLPALSVKDKRDLAWGVKNGVDVIFASFIRKAADIDLIRSVLGEEGKNIKVCCKIENHEGIQKFDEILKATDSVMVARGDMGIEIPPEKVFIAQKMMISKCMMAGKPIIVATQMLESMVKNPRPTRAETLDVANAILDGADCVMLSGETAKGKYPLQAVQMMEKICREAEATVQFEWQYNMIKASIPKPMPIEESIASSAVMASFDNFASLIIVLTNSGLTARLVAKYRPHALILAVIGKSNKQSGRQLKLTRGVRVCYCEDKDGRPSSDDRVNFALTVAQKRGYVDVGDFVIAVHSDELGSGYANLTRVIQIKG